MRRSAASANEVAKRKICVDGGDPVHDTGSDEESQENGEQNRVAHALREEADHCSGEADREEPVLKVQRGGIGRPHCVEGAGLDRRWPRRERRKLRQQPQELGVQLA